MLFVSDMPTTKFQSTRPVRDATWEFFEALNNLMFQSTRPVRDATLLGSFGNTEYTVSIHASRTGRDLRVWVDRHNRGVSIHASRTGRDLSFLTLPKVQECFNPRVPYGTRPDTNVVDVNWREVSIHASRTGRDIRQQSGAYIAWYRFNPRVPYGTRLTARSGCSSQDVFQSTRPVRDATQRAAN